MASAASFVQLPLLRMVDLAISSPDGAVNFHLLQAILHALIQKSSAQTVSIEIHGAEATKLQEQLKVTGDKPTFSIKETTDKNAQGKDQTVYIMNAEGSYHGTSSVSKEKIDELDSEINEIKKQIQEIRDLPGNLGIINAVKNSNEQASAVIDVFHMLALQKRIEAAEEGMVKVATIVEDLIKSPGALTLETKNVICQKDEDSAKTEKSGRSSIKSTKTSKTSITDVDFLTRLKTLPLDEQVRELISEVNNLRKRCGDQENSVISHILKDLQEIQTRLKMKKGKSTETLSAGEEGEDIAGIPSDIELGLMEEKFKAITSHLERLDLTFNDEISRLHNQFTDIEKDFNELLNKIEMGLASGDSNEPNACCSAVYQKMLQLQTDFVDLTETSNKLIEDKDEKSKMMDVLLEQIEVLKTVKADREDIEEALADKADACAVLRKVSHDQFDSACEELSKGIEEALEKLTQQELLWQQALDDIQNEIGNKLDKMDLGPLREFINNKLRLLQDKMKSLAALKREQEAAGTKNKLLRDVNCISCDKDVVMRKDYDLSFRPIAPMVPPTRSMAPYLAYELDALRKQQKAIPGSKNLHNFEAAMQGRLQKKTDDHICNRYCGGSHTITTPQQRVTRLGHFLMQWGPEAQPSTTSEHKRTSGSFPHPTSVIMQSEAGPASPKPGPKAEPSKRASKLSQSKISSKTGIEDAQRVSTESAKKRLSAMSAGDGKRSATSLKVAASKTKEGATRTNGSKSLQPTQEVIPEEGHEGAEEAAAPVEGATGEAVPVTTEHPAQTIDGTIEEDEGVGEAAPLPEDAAHPETKLDATE